MEHARFTVELAPPRQGVRLPGREHPVSARGAEDAAFVLAANPGEAAGPLSRIASGGEASRVMLALKNVLRNVDPVPLVIFDEVDAGIGGLVAEAVGARLAAIAGERQVLVVTHLAVIAGRAGHHLRLVKTSDKKRTRIEIEEVAGKVREEELARMLAGSAGGDDARRTDPALDTIVPDSADQAYDMKAVIRSIVDNGEVFEPHEHFARNIIVCFARLNGRPVGIIANQPKALAGCLDINASDKATRFIRFCDAFNIPLLTIADVPGYLPGSHQEWGGIIRHGAKLLWCYSEATVPKLLLVTRKDYGGSYLAMCSRDLGADMAFAWPTAEIAVMGAEGAANIIHRKEITDAADPGAKREEKIAEYETLFSNPYVAAARGYIDAVIVPSETRARLIDALETMCAKRELRPPKKHGNIPM